MRGQPSTAAAHYTSRTCLGPRPPSTARSRRVDARSARSSHGAGHETIDGKAVAAAVRAEVGSASTRSRARGVVPGLATVLVGDDPASRVYVGSKERACVEVGMRVVRASPARRHVDGGAARPGAGAQRAITDVHGILVQLPLPSGIDAQAVIEAIAPEKDVDGLHRDEPGPAARGRAGAAARARRSGSCACSTRSVCRCAGARAVVVGRSLLVGQAGGAAAARAPRDRDDVPFAHARPRRRGRRAPTSWSRRSGQPGLIRGRLDQAGRGRDRRRHQPRSRRQARGATSSSRPRASGPSRSRRCRAASGR